jgi:hypothetical protein
MWPVKASPRRSPIADSSKSKTDLAGAGPCAPTPRIRSANPRRPARPREAHHEMHEQSIGTSLAFKEAVPASHRSDVVQIGAET